MRHDTPARQVDRLFRRGVPIQVLAEMFGQTRSGILRAINETRARRLLGVEIRYVPHPDFEDPSRHEEILGPNPPADDAPRRFAAGAGYEGELARLAGEAGDLQPHPFRLRNAAEPCRKGSSATGRRSRLWRPAPTRTRRRSRPEFGGHRPCPNER